MEPNTSTMVSPNSDKVMQNNNDTKWKVITAVASVIAICGVGFGIFKILENNKK